MNAHIRNSWVSATLSTSSCSCSTIVRQTNLSLDVCDRGHPLIFQETALQWLLLKILSVWRGDILYSASTYGKFVVPDSFGDGT